MPNSSKILFLFVLAGAFLLSSCRKNDCDSEIPQIEFKEFEKYSDSAHVTISFYDCNGDIGLSESDTVAPYDYNMFLDYYERHDGAWQKIDPLYFPFYYRIPDDIMSGKEEDPLQGDITVTLFEPYYRTGIADTIKFEIYIKDLALNESNSVSTGTIVVSD